MPMSTLGTRREPNFVRMNKKGCKLMGDICSWCLIAVELHFDGIQVVDTCAGCVLGMCCLKGFHWFSRRGV